MYMLLINVIGSKPHTSLKRNALAKCIMPEKTDPMRLI